MRTPVGIGHMCRVVRCEGSRLVVFRDRVEEQTVARQPTRRFLTHGVARFVRHGAVLRRLTMPRQATAAASSTAAMVHQPCTNAVWAAW